MNLFERLAEAGRPETLIQSMFLYAVEHCPRARQLVGQRAGKNLDESPAERELSDSESDWRTDVTFCGPSKEPVLRVELKFRRGKPTQRQLEAAGQNRIGLLVAPRTHDRSWTTAPFLSWHEFSEAVDANDPVRQLFEQAATFGDEYECPELAADVAQHEFEAFSSATGRRTWPKLYGFLNTAFNHGLTAQPRLRVSDRPTSRGHKYYGFYLYEERAKTPGLSREVWVGFVEPKRTGEPPEIEILSSQDGWKGVTTYNSYPLLATRLADMIIAKITDGGPQS